LQSFEGDRKYRQATAGICSHSKATAISTGESRQLKALEGDSKYLKATASICSHLQATPNI
jgi:hypothetical protein